MRLLCPHCGRAYIVRDEALAPAGRTVRCSSCKSTWFASQQGEPKTPVLAYDGVDPHALIEQVRKATVEKPSLKSQKPATTGGIRLTAQPGLAVLGLFALFLVSGLIFRESIVRTMPSLAQLYKSMGLPVNVRGLEFMEVKSSRETQNGENVLVVYGKIANIRPGAVDVPYVRVALRSPTGAEIDAAIAKPDLSRLERAGETAFKTILVNPAPDARDVLVHFSDLQNLGS